MSNGSRARPQDVGEAISLITATRSGGSSTFRRGRIEDLESEARRLLLGIRAIRGNLSSEQRGVRGNLHTPLPQEPLEPRDMGGAEWREEFIGGIPMLGRLAEPGVCPSPTK